MQLSKNPVYDDRINTAIKKLTMKEILESNDLSESLYKIVQFEQSEEKENEIIKFHTFPYITNFYNLSEEQHKEKIERSKRAIKIIQAALESEVYEIEFLVKKMLQSPKTVIKPNENLFKSHWKTDKLEEVYSANPKRFIKNRKFDLIIK